MNKRKVTIEEVKDKYSFTYGQARDKETHKVYHCPKTLGFNITFKQCINQSCKECWNEISDYLNFIESKKKREV